MNTPAHVVLNTFVLARGRFRSFVWPLALGALLPDLPMLGFYAYQRGWLALPERAIWSQAYFLPHWQRLFDAFNSLPLMALAALFAWRARRPAWLACLASMALHSASDLLLHHDDAHGHLWPLNDWHFRSPVSYWDPRHHGSHFAVLELAASLAASALLWRRGGASRWVGGGGLACYGAFLVFAALRWGAHGH
jgi:hypothetical protein